MMKKLVLVGLTAMLLCGCGHETEAKTETVSVVETTTETTEDTIDELILDYVVNAYIEAMKEIYGDSFNGMKAICNLNGITYEGRFVTWEYVEELAYNSMFN